MQIISGIHRGRKLFTPLDKGVRPTAAKMREAIFNILNNLISFEEATIMDLCCGTGALGIEAISRGAKKVIFIDGSTEHLKLARANIAQIKEEEKSIILRANATNLPTAQLTCNLIFLDPPYNKKIADKALISLTNEGWLKSGSLVIVEQDKREDLKYSVDNYKELLNRVYGNSKIIILESI